jgi:hypothetical protein
MKTRSRHPIPIYPLLFAVASVLSLVATNIAEMELTNALRTLVIFLLVSGLFLLLAKVCFRNWHKAAFFTVVAELVFVSYGQVFDLLKNSSFGSSLAHHRFLIIASCIIIGLAVIISIRMKNPFRWTHTLNLVMAIFVILPIYQIVSAKISDLKNTQQQSDLINNNQKEFHLQAQENPDIYYIILDSYTRGDALLSDYQFDNTDFLTKLRDMGFYVADCSRSNYAHTRLSLASSMNLDYLQNLGLDFTSGTLNINSLTPYILNSLLQNELSKLGYKTVAFQTGYPFTDMKNANYYIRTDSSQFFSPYLESFEYLFLQNSAFRIILNTQTRFVDRYITPLGILHADYRIRIQNIFKDLPEIAKIASPKFVFVHLDIPHHPFLFLPDGSVNPDPSYYPPLLAPSNIELRKTGYINQVQYVNLMVIRVLEGIFTNSENPPIIILQGDHGMSVEARDKILNAIYMPNGGMDDLYPSISPVNTFRVIFNNYFGTTLPLLEDKTYNSIDETKVVLQLKDETSPNCMGK